MAKKKNYNPFRMWGSYVGAYFIIPILLVIFAGPYGSISLEYIDMPFKNVFEFFTWPFVHYESNSRFFYIGLFSDAVSYFLIFLIIIAGFLVGWGIHSLFRKFMR